MSATFSSLFGQTKPVIAMLHLPALPGTPFYQHSTAAIIAHVLAEAALYQKAGVHALMLENMHDVPYLNGKVGPEITALMGIIAHEVKQATKIPCGIQILAGANCAALAVAKAAGLDFIRAEGFVFAHVADEGLIQADAGVLLRYRKQISAESVLVFTDIKKKHSSHALTADVNLAETAKAATFFRSDGLIVTGSSTGVAASINDLQAVKKSSTLPLLIGSGITIQNIGSYYPLADAFIVGSYFKKHGHWANTVDDERVHRFMEKVGELAV